jgi:hypothetical protein
MNRGGRGQGRGKGGGMKRKPNTPVGGAYKDQRRGLNSDEMDDDDDDEEWTEVSYTRKSPQRQEQQTQPQSDPMASSSAQASQERPSFASIAAQPSSASLQNRRNSNASANYNQRKTLEKMFVTPAPNGAMRDEITIEVQTVNGKPFKGSLTFHEALEGIYIKCLELDRGLLHGIRFRFSQYPTIKYKLKQQIDIDELKRIEYFEFFRHYTAKGEARYDTFGCKINGIRATYDAILESDPDPNIRWVKIEWTEYSVQEKHIVDWLTLYGEPASELSEDVHPNSDSDADPVGIGTYSIKMRLNKEIPQLLPMKGRRIRVYYRGVTKLCPNCFGAHARKNCRSEKVSWIQYVLRFMENNPDIPPDFYGKWWKIVNEEFGEIVPDNSDQLRDQEDHEQANTDNLEVADARPTAHRAESNPAPTSDNRRQNQSTREQLSKEESDNLCDYLSIGMSISEARNAFQKEIEMAELKQRIRETKRNQLRGSIGNQNRTTIGNTQNRGGGRGGLSFN